MRVVVFTLTHDYTGCFAVVLGLRAVGCLLSTDWGSSMTGLVNFDLLMTPHGNGLSCEQEVFLPRDFTSSPESFLGNIEWDHESDGMKKISVGSHTPTSISHWTYALGETPAATSPKSTKMPWEHLEVTWGMRTSLGIAVILDWLNP